MERKCTIIYILLSLKIALQILILDLSYTFVHATPSRRQEDFIKSHVLAFEFYEGVPKILVPDNLKSAVISNNKKGIVLNESFKA